MGILYFVLGILKEGIGLAFLRASSRMDSWIGTVVFADKSQ